MLWRAIGRGSVSSESEIEAASVSGILAVIRNSLLLLFLGLLASIPAQAQQLLTPETTARAISLTEAETPKGAVLVSEVTHVFQVSEQEDYVGILQDFDYRTSDGLLVITCIFGAFESRQEAAYAFHSMRTSDRSGRSDWPDIGEESFGRNPGTVCFLQDRAVVFLKVERGADYNAESNARIGQVRNEFLNPILRKLDSEGFTNHALTESRKLDPRVYSIVLSGEEVGPGFRAGQADLQTLESKYGAVSTFLLQTYYSEGYPDDNGLSAVTIRYGVFNGDEALSRAWERLSRSNAGALHDPDLRYGDVCLSTLFESYVRFVKDHAIVELSVAVNEPDRAKNRELRRRFRDELASKISTKIEALNLLPSPDGLMPVQR